MNAGTEARRQRNDLGSDTPRPDCPATLRPRDDLARAPFRKWRVIVGTKARLGRSDLGLHAAEPDDSTIERERDDRGRTPFPGGLMPVALVEWRPNIVRRCKDP